MILAITKLRLMRRSVRHSSRSAVRSRLTGALTVLVVVGLLAIASMVAVRVFSVGAPHASSGTLGGWVGAAMGVAIARALDRDIAVVVIMGGVALVAIAWWSRWGRGHRGESRGDGELLPVMRVARPDRSLVSSCSERSART
jgi:hypothetical protein